MIEGFKTSGLLYPNFYINLIREVFPCKTQVILKG